MVQNTNWILDKLDIRQRKPWKDELEFLWNWEFV